MLCAFALSLPAAERVTVTVLATTDMHGFIYPHDYFTGKPAPRGLAAAATLIDQVRREAPHTVLVDCGDTIQGSTLEGVHQAAVRAGTSTAPDPMMLAMNAVGYDAMVVGNHEFNYGLKNLAAARTTARFPWLSANTRTGPSVPPFAPYVVKVVGGVKVAVIGVTTAAVPQWEKPEQIEGFSWTTPEEGVRRALESLRTERPDLVIVAAHGGLDRDPATGTARAGEMAWRQPRVADRRAVPAGRGGHLRSHPPAPGRAAGRQGAARAAAELGDGRGSPRLHADA